MSSLFSVFDPICSNSFFCGNFKWLGVLIVFLFFNWQFYPSFSGFLLFFSSVKYNLINEFKNLFGFKYKSVVLISFSLFYLIFMSSFLGMFPFYFTPSSHLMYNLCVSLPLWLGGCMYMYINSWSNFFSHFLPLGTPFILIPFLVIIELISTLIRPFSLGVRLMSNMMAGHLILTLLESNQFLSFLGFFPIMSLGSFISLFEIGVSCIQAYVFSSLMSLYWKENM
uniref:ATP synthase F0 subunit 6 n=1 Tax=Falcolipeurus marginalis TaxID=236517 RepID=UPI00211E9C02|nr:ATP synthase F0 subunit 6 [Falcolipeurus marginalis]UTT72596.1 ATP synthase F0 subunit 6 [Falcolipeurus marginalis]